LDGENRGSEGFVSMREVCEKFDRCKAGGGNAEMGSDFGEGDEDEGALSESGMRDFETGFAEDEIAIEEDVEVEGAGAVGDGAGAIAAEEALDG